MSLLWLRRTLHFTLAIMENLLSVKQKLEDQAALESALAFLAYAGDDVHVRALPLALWPNGMALRTLYDAPAPEALIPFEVPSEVVAFHANYVVGASQKRAWLESLGLWFI